MITHYYHGKLLLTGEYFVLDGTPALAAPTRQGQSFTIEPHPGPELLWEATDSLGNCWFSGILNPHQLREVRQPANPTLQRLSEIFAAGQALRSRSDAPPVAELLQGKRVRAQLEFDKNWGLGSSSTLIAFVADWLGVDPYNLLQATFGGSGYDLACALASGPILFRRAGSGNEVSPLNWHPEWLGKTCFVYRNRKQNSREGIRAYREQSVTEESRQRIGDLTTALLHPTSLLRSAAQILREHESIVGETLGLTPVQEERFPEFPGQIKSLGAWGGDFMWALSEAPQNEIRRYFEKKGYPIIIGYDDMMLRNSTFR